MHTTFKEFLLKIVQVIFFGPFVCCFNVSITNYPLIWILLGLPL